jgi:hypothetical protein
LKLVQPLKGHEDGLKRGTLALHRVPTVSTARRGRGGVVEREGELSPAYNYKTMHF